MTESRNIVCYGPSGRCLSKRLTTNEMRLAITEGTHEGRGWAAWGRLAVALAFVATLLGLGAANIALRASWSEVEDGVLWVAGPQGVTAADDRARIRRRRASA